MNSIYKISLFLMFLLYIGAVQASIGCKKIEHTVNYWNVSKPQFIKCSCPCNNVVSSDRGQCTQCGHFGRPDRGEISKRVLAEQGIAHK